jgi:hydroxymethylpyrimidine/phosphomethylpyrimidine kinase
MKPSQRKAQIKQNHKLTRFSRPFSSIPVTLTIAGSDSSGGAGIQADLKTFSTLRTYGTSAITSVVAEHPGRVSTIVPIPTRNVVDQIRLIFEAYPVAAIKTGMLFSRPIIEAVSDELKSLAPRVPLVIDPVMVASSGAPLLQPAAISVLRKKFLPQATVVTPNRDEAALLWGKPIRNLEELERAGIELSDRFGVAFLVKGGHLQSKKAVDLLCVGSKVTVYQTAMIPGANPHGTGCTLSAALAASLAKGLPLPKAVAAAKRFITHAVRTRFQLGKFRVLNQI